MDLLKKAARHYINGIIQIIFELIVFVLMFVFFPIVFPYMLGVQSSRNEEFFDRFESLGFFAGVLLGGSTWGLATVAAIVALLDMLFGS